jgi:iron complex outermembrane recepter protein
MDWFAPVFEGLCSSTAHQANLCTTKTDHKNNTGIQGGSNMSSKSIRLRNAALCSVSIAALLTASGFTISTARAQSTQLPGVTIYSTTPQLASEGPGEGTEDQPVSSATTVEDPESPARPPSTGDSGEFLRHVNGVDAARMGGHGLDPVIRGLDQNQLGITNDGAFHFGGCPNRMDPPTSHMQLYTYDKVIIKKGYQSVLDGPPAPGGSIQFERINPTFAPGMEVTTNFKAGTGYNSNGEGKEAFVDMSMGNDWGYIRGFGSYASANNYKDGDGNEVRSSFDQFGGGIILGRTFDNDSWVTLKVENNNVDDALFPGSGMDAPVTDDWTYQLKGETDLEWGAITGVKGDIYLTTVDHSMDNFSLRPNSSRYREARMEADTLGGKMVFNGMVGGTSFDIGTDYRDVKRDGNRYDTGPGGGSAEIVQAVLWPDTSIKEWGLFGETVMPLSPTTKLTTGMRYAYVNASVDRADEHAAPGMMLGGGFSPNDLYAAYYGVSDPDKTEHNFSGLLRLEEDLGDGLTLFGSLSRSVRTADATERFMASHMVMMGTNKSWVGNPDLDPEKHHQVELGVSYLTPGFDLKGSTYYNRVTDFIQLDTARGQRGVLVNDPTRSVYTNIDAVLAGVEAEAEFRFASVWRVNLSGAYTYGENLSDDIALAQISPLSGRFEMAYDDKVWMAGLRVNVAAKQNRIDDDTTTGSGQDVGKTSGYATLDLFGAYNVDENFQITAGVTNVFDKAYANHLNKKDGFNNAVQVNEPGRSFYIRAVTKF